MSFEVAKLIEAKVDKIQAEVDSLRALKDKAFAERNELVQLLAAAYEEAGFGAAGIRMGTENDEWPVVFINLAEGEIAYHIPKTELLFSSEEDVVDQPYVAYDDATKRARIRSAFERHAKAAAGNRS